MSISAKLLEKYLEHQQTNFGLARNFSPPALSKRLARPIQKPSLQNRSLRMDTKESSYMGRQNFPISTPVQGFATQWSEERVHQIQARLARKLGPEYITQRPGPGGSSKLCYIEGWKVVELANDVFGFNGWSTTVVSLTTDFLDVNKDGRVSVNCTAIIRVTLLDGTFHEDVGCGQGDNMKGRGAALDKAQKEAITDGTKRALRSFGNMLGNCLYDKDYTKEVVKMRVPPVRFNRDTLERRPEFLPTGVPAMPAAGPSYASPIPSHLNNGPRPQAPVPVQNNPLPPQNIPFQPPAAPATPLKSLNEAQDEDVPIALDENFDPEFADFYGSDSIFAELDDQSIQAGPNFNNSNNMDPETPKPVPMPEQPAYQHRQGPDLTKTVSDNQITTPKPANQFNPPSKPALNPQSGNHYVCASKDPPKIGPSHTPPIADNQNNQTGGPSSSAGSTSGSKPALPKPRPLGSFAFPGKQTPKESRAKAIASAFKQAGRTPKSPRIPSGGVDFVAKRATTKLMVEGARLGLEENCDIDPVADGFQGFASAKGLKRLPEEQRRSMSPTKERSNPGLASNGSRTALGELPMEDESSWPIKRQRTSK
ncbi:DNA strand annealing protein, putative [Cryptococcus gattii WM276]|uniref:DNA strand annealing protein, putative n=2 Tax=Cryptococcus gattii TaxID=37769 RepID=E6R1C3_CRYGW|nr:DNA strand annealing protein, putative [Cryptococcus gattii WM276]ADV20615.1 DNA strand annealing protein, putative [Cryptococcus gattii WM276]KIR76840.1 DNA repair and recombination protein RAD52 [Cryptococcus gattii EJB2]KJE01394.1 DNA repair and recombination protein RAD52 [Cryptococcus gattii NT-10]